jgi:hypothetical protein
MHTIANLSFSSHANAFDRGLSLKQFVPVHRRCSRIRLLRA